MQNIIEELQHAGLTGEEAMNSIKIIRDFLNKHYPLLAAVSASTIFSEHIVQDHELR